MKDRPLSVVESTDVTKLSWSDFQSQMDWEQGEHVSLIGATECGKTTLAKELIKLPPWVVALSCKPKDSTMDGLIRKGFKKITEWPPQAYEKRVVLWPPISKRWQIAQQRYVFQSAIDAIYESGGWCVYADELGYMTAELNMQRAFNMLWQQGRSIGITLVASMQRPRHVSLNAYTQATHIFFWRQNDEQDLKRIAGIGWVNSKVIREVVSRLNGPPRAGWNRNECSEFLYVNTRSGKLIQSRVEGVK
jgi:hypothetical protein